MLYLLMAIFSSTSIFILFKIFEKFSVKPYPAIVLNYFVAGILGFIIFKGYHTDFFYNLSVDWRIWIIVIGLLFFLNFLLIQYSTAFIGMATTSVACKISVVIPIVFSIFYDNEQVGFAKFGGILMALVAILLLTYKKNEQKNVIRWWQLLLPVILFVGLGSTDTMVKFVQQEHAKQYSASQLTSFFFGFSFLSAFLWGIFKNNFFKSFVHVKTFVLGSSLGVVNFGSIYFLILSLQNVSLDDSLIFGIINLGIILLSVLIGHFIFNEKLLNLNWLGILLALLSFILLSIHG
ncbi:MAG: hypothetical protein N2449_06340 [Bacteroidales bacterium]|nr:hypothetical protein [Bacteroidales bacterium]